MAGAVLYPTLFFVAGYFVAWQNAAVRAYYEGPAVPLPLLEHLARMVATDPGLVPFEMARGLLWVAIGWPVLRGTRGPWWVGGLLFAALIAVVQNDVHLFGNPLMPREVRLWHLVEGRGWDHPHPRAFTWLAAPLELLLAVSGLVGGAILFVDPSGGGMQLDLAFLGPTPFPDYEVPGVVLFLANGVLPSGALVALLVRSRSAPWWVAATGAVLTGWMAAQVAWMGLLFWLQPVMTTLGLTLLGIGGAWILADRRATGAGRR